MTRNHVGILAIFAFGFPAMLFPQIIESSWIAIAWFGIGAILLFLRIVFLFRLLDETKMPYYYMAIAVSLLVVFAGRLGHESLIGTALLVGTVINIITLDLPTYRYGGKDGSTEQ